MTAIFDEYRRFADPKARFLDQQFIDLFDVGSLRPFYLAQQQQLVATLRARKQELLMTKQVPPPPSSETHTYSRKSARTDWCFGAKSK